MLIGELAQRCEVSSKAIRYYEDIGVLDQAERTPSGYRNYGQTAVDRLAFIKAAQAVGLTLAEIREIIGFRDRDETPCGHVRELIDDHARSIDEQIRDLSVLRSELKRLSTRARQLDPRDCDPSEICHIIPR